MWEGFGAGLLDFAGGLFSNKKNIDLAREQMAFQREMANTQYQRAAKDLEKAGLNRILALGSPAAAPGGARAQILNPASGAANSAAKVSLLKEQKDLMEKQADLVNQQRYQSAATTQAELSRSLKLDRETIQQQLRNQMTSMELEFWRKNPLAFELNLANNPLSLGVQSGKAVLDTATKVLRDPWKNVKRLTR